MQNLKINILNSSLKDIDEIFRLYKIATDFQKIKFPDNQWPVFERSLVTTEIKENRQWKIVINNTIACIWATNFSDPEIWKEKDIDPAVYIHRIATNPDFRGQNLVLEIVKWATIYAFENDKNFVRMDTCGDNNKLINHYTTNGFEFLGMKKLKNSNNLPSHYLDADVCYFEINLKHNS